MSLLKTIFKTINEEAAAGATSSANIATNQSAGFSRDKTKLGSKIIKRKPIKKIFKEDKDYDKMNVMAKIKNSEIEAKNNKNNVGFALEDDEDNIIKVFVKQDQADDFESALNSELSKNQNDEHSHREIGEILFDLRNDFDIVNIEMNSIPEDEEEIDKVEADDTSNLELNDEPDEDDLDLDDPKMKTDKKDEPDLDDDMIPSEEPDTDTDTKSALDAVINMMVADAEARKADAEAKTKESEAKIAALNTQAAEAQVKKSEEIMDMEAYYNKQSDEDKEAKQLAKLAKYKHDLKSDEVEAKDDHLDFESNTKNESKRRKGRFLDEAISQMLNKSINK